jgi:two-component system OmpR family response regulator
MTQHILVVEDEREIADLAELHLTDAGYQVSVLYSGTMAAERLASEEFSLVILDIGLPGIDGLELCRRIRAREGAYTPVLMLTARSSELDRVLGLEMGSDDYLTKPFSVRELMARVKAILRRAEAMAPAETRPPETIRAGDLEVDPISRQARLGDQPVELTAKEFDLLHHFASHPERVFTRTQLLDSVWGYAHDGYEHTVNTHINRLRRKIEPDPANPRYIVTVWGVGYRFPANQEIPR